MKILKFIASRLGYDIIPKSFSNDLLQKSTEFENEASYFIDFPYKQGKLAGKSEMALEISTKIFHFNQDNIDL